MYVYDLSPQGFRPSRVVPVLAVLCCFTLILVARALACHVPPAWQGDWPTHVIANQRHVVDRFFPFDAVWYDRIATLGYVWAPATPSAQQDLAFFPLWPMVQRLLGLALPAGAVPWGLVGVAALCAACAIAAFDRLARRVMPEGGATTATFLFALYPAASFMLLSYPTGLMNLLCIGAVLGVMERRFAAAAALSGLATAAGPLGLGTAMMVGACAALHVAPALLLVRTAPAESCRAMAWLLGVGLLSVSGLLAFLAWQHLVLGDAFAFMEAQTAWEVPLPLGLRLWRTVQQLLILPDFGNAFSDIRRILHPRSLVWLEQALERSLNCVSLGLELVTLLACVRFAPRPVLLQAAFTLGLFIWFHSATRPGNSTLRLTYCAVGIFLGGAWLLRGRPRLAGCVVAASAALMAGGAFLVGAGYHMT